jgi:hypothetical protein
LRKSILIASLLVSLAMAVPPAPTIGKRGPSTPEERQRFVAIVHKLEESPLDKSLRKEREWAIHLLAEAPDQHVGICFALLGDFAKSKHKYATEIVEQLGFSIGVYAIEHMGQTVDVGAQYVAGVEGALRAYQAILTNEPDAKSKALDDLLEKQKEGTLTDFVRDASKTRCRNYGGWGPS